MDTAPLKGARLSIRHLTVQFGGVQVLQDLSLDVAPGETVALMGRSGTGKTTLLKCAAMFLTPSTGDAWLDGQAYISAGVPLYEPWEVRSKVILVWQDFPLFPNMNGLDNISLPLRHVKHLGKHESIARAKHLSEILSVGHALERFPSSYSGGEAQRIALIRAILLQPKVLLLDEITSALDSETVQDVTEALGELRLQEECIGTSIVVVTHLADFAAKFADRTLYLNDGELSATAPKHVSSCNTARDAAHPVAVVAPPARALF